MYDILSIAIIAFILNLLTTIIAVVRITLIIEHRITSLEVSLKNLEKSFLKIEKRSKYYDSEVE